MNYALSNYAPWPPSNGSGPVSALQYAETAKILLTLSLPESKPDSSHSPLDLVQKRTIRVCGLAFTNEDLGATVNGFGPLLFCKFVLVTPHRE